MTRTYQYKKVVNRSLLLGLMAIGLVACGSDDDDNNDTPETEVEVSTQEFEIEIINLTAGQPFSPIAVIAHGADYRLFTLGDSATVGMETLAEGGDNSGLISEAETNDSVLMTLSGETPLPPGSTETFTLEVNEEDLTGLLISGITMLVNTNDAITAAQGISLESMAIGDSISLNTIGYDSGTEANSELAGTIPGPAVGGEGFNAERDDIADEIRMHSGVITADDGLATSRLTQVHRWDNPVARIRITRTE